MISASISRYLVCCNYKLRWITVLCLGISAAWILVFNPLKIDISFSPVSRITANHSRIVFMETSGKGVVRLRYCAAIEAAAFHNPKKTVIVYLFSKENVPATSLMSILESKYSNIIFSRHDLETFVKGTELESWYQKGAWRTSVNPMTHLSDGLRFLILYQLGGIYMDLDVISLKELRYPVNTLFRERGDYDITNSVMAFDIKHPLIYITLKHFVRDYNPAIYAANGPQLLSKEFSIYNKTKGIKIGIIVLPAEEVNAIQWEDSKKYFDESIKDEVLQSLRKSSAAHIFGIVTHGVKINKDSTSAYMKLVQTHAPYTYSEIQRIGFA